MVFLLLLPHSVSAPSQLTMHLLVRLEIRFRGYFRRPHCLGTSEQEVVCCAGSWLCPNVFRLTNSVLHRVRRARCPW